MSSRFRKTFRALRHRNYRLWFFGHGLSRIGTWMQIMAQQVLVYRLTGSAISLGIVNFMAVIPIFLLALWGGSLSDRVPKRKILVITQTLMLVQAIILTILTWTELIEVWQIYMMSFLLGALKAVDTPTRHSFVIEMIEDKKDLTNAIGLNSAIQNGAKTLGPAIAGVVVATMGETSAFFINSLSFIIVIISLLMMKDLPNEFMKPKQDGKVLPHMIEGLRYIKKQQTILILMSLVAVSSFLSKPYKTLMPVLADKVFKESSQSMIDFLCGQDTKILNCKFPEALTLGLLFAAVGLGAVVGAFIVASLPEGAKRGRLLTLGNLSFPILLLLFVNIDAFEVSLILVFMVGLSNVFQNSMANTLIQTSVPDQLRGRVMSMYSMISQGMSRIGGLQAGFSADLIGAPLSIGVGAFLSLLFGLFVAFRYKDIRQIV